MNVAGYVAWVDYGIDPFSYTAARAIHREECLSGHCEPKNKEDIAGMHFQRTIDKTRTRERAESVLWSSFPRFYI